MRSVEKIKCGVGVRQLVSGKEAEIGFGCAEFFSEILVLPEHVELLKIWITLHGRLGFRQLDVQKYLEALAIEYGIEMVMDELDKAQVSYKYLFANSFGEAALRSAK